jgi:Uma2 family endonuclease
MATVEQTRAFEIGNGADQSASPLVVRLPDPFTTPWGQIALRFDTPGGLDDEAFWELCQANEELCLERTADGGVIVMAPAGNRSDERGGELFGHLWTWNRRQGRGRCNSSSAGFTFPSGAVLSPDVAWISHQRLAATTPEDQERFVHAVPEFVAEVVSPSQTRDALRPRMIDYIEQGVLLAWLVDPQTQTVEIFRPGREPETLNRPGSLCGEEPLPGLVVPMKGILFD